MQVNEQSVSVRLSLLELQTARLVSDQESEKGSRARENTRFHQELSEIKADQKELRIEQQKMAKILYTICGGLVVLQVGLQFFKT